MVPLLGQVSAEKLKDISSLLCDGVMESEDSLVMVAEVVGSIKEVHGVCVFFLSLIFLNWLTNFVFL